MNHKYIHASLTRISDLAEKEFEVKGIPKESWHTGDYVACKVINAGAESLKIELPNGRMRGVISGESIIGALGERFATLEATGSWRNVTENLKMSVLTGAGLMGKLTSKSIFIPKMMRVAYVGHVFRGEDKVTMDSFVKPIETVPFNTPVILFVGTSMSAGKTTSGRIVTNIFKQAGYRVVGAKLTGAGRFKDILAFKDAGADAILDFVDVGLPSSICPKEIYQQKLEQMLSMISSQNADIAIVEIGASPLEPYNGDSAIDALREHIKCTILSASDPYAVHGLMKAFDIVPDIVTGIATNTLAGVRMVEKLCRVKALNLIDSTTMTGLKRILTATTGFSFEQK
ncbi:hypothetical protein [Flagellimonas meridianipacifica]|uniref:DUF1611 domain-containing protein n=1 Tax=Flagellimonas meridianipacifica TaxID=1080225 RepID=A0A2T0MAW4_9FLAO|nr:hypothetical protein [Allomuricauda pacifica]PRX54648.1 hypothetical protein CLV81_3050 [Allomuricauda pacifica]